MIVIRPAVEDEAARLAAQAGIAGDPLCLVLEDGGQRRGQAFYRRAGETMELLAVAAPGAAETEGLVRAALHAAEGAGARVAHCGYAPLFALLRTLGFRPEGEGMTAEIAAIFARGCRGCGG